MATADEILSQLATEEDKVLVINNDLRTIAIPQTVKMLGVESDEEVLRLHFRMPKVYGETDLSEFVIRINYINAKGSGDIYTVSDASVVDDAIIFSWLISRNATAYKGSVRFIVCLKLYDDAGVLIKEYNTTVASLPVLEGLEIENVIIDQNPTIIEDILLRLSELENGDTGVKDYDLLENKPIKNVTSTKDNLVALRDLESGVYRLSGSFVPFQGSNAYFSFSNNQLVNIVTKTAGTHVQIFYPIDNVIQFVSIMVDSTSDTGYTYERVNIKLNELQTKPKAVTIELPADSWTGEGMVYHQTVSVPLVTSNSQVDLRPSPEQLQNLLTSEISLTAANDNGSVTVFAIGGAPTSDYSMQVIVSEVNVV